MCPKQLRDQMSKYQFKSYRPSKQVSLQGTGLGGFQNIRDENSQGVRELQDKS
jgi:hypothetical protein